jgi:hypothetical protein
LMFLTISTTKLPSQCFSASPFSIVPSKLDIH